MINYNHSEGQNRTIVAQAPSNVGTMTFGDLKPAATDPVLGLMSRFRADGRARKLDLGVGVYRDAAGHTPVFKAVKAAEHRLDPDLRGWERIATEIAARGLIPLIAYSCDKNFGLYRERVGALFVAGATPSETQTLLSHLIALARASYSMPPDHGAAVVRLILEDPALAAHGRVGAVDLASLADGHGFVAALGAVQHQHAA
jgi:aspartate/tyrosine/aromatic aminotransferase